MAEMQLKMRRYSQPVKERVLPDGFAFKPFDGSEREIDEWVRLCNFGLMEGSTRETFFETVGNFPNVVAERDCFFVMDAEGRYVASSTAVANPDGLGLVHMVASDPTTRGKGIGHAMLSYALEKLEARSCTYSILTTDDFRLAAIKTYLDAGFRPVLLSDPDSDQRTRWDAVIAQLGYEPVEYFDEV